MFHFFMVRLRYTYFLDGLMNFKLLLILTIFALHISSQAATILLLDPCTGDVVLNESLVVTKDMTLGEMTVNAFDKLDIEYIGSNMGMNTILGTPTGLEAMDIVARDEMYAYGWCFTINGELAEVYPDKVILSESDKVIWSYGFAHYLRGKWFGQCTSSLNRPASFCHE